MKKGWAIFIKIIDGLVWIWNAIRGKLPSDDNQAR